MSFGLLPLLLRLLLGALLLGDAIQKPFGWFRGQGPTGTGVIFRGWGVRSGKQMTLLSSVSPLLRRRQVLAAGR